MRRPILLGVNPYLSDYYRKDAKTLLAETGGNTGNLAFMFAVSRHVPQGRTVHWDMSVRDIRAAGDIVVLALANQLGKHTDLDRAAARLEELGLPVIGLGLGAQAPSMGADVELAAGTERWLRTLAKLRPSDAPNIGVRGAYTKAQIARLGMPDAAVVTGCPSNFISMNDDVAGKVARGFSRKPRHIAVAAGIPYIPALAGIERDLADIVTQTGGAYIVQHGLEMLQLARNEFDVMAPEKFELCRRYIMPNRSADEFKAWCRQYAYAHYDARSWMDFMRRFDFVVGTRFHGVMLAFQAGVPGGCIAHDSRTQEMCETMGIPVRHHSEITGGLTQHNVMDYFKFDPKQYRETRRTLQEAYVGVLTGADLPIPRNLAPTPVGRVAASPASVSPASVSPVSVSPASVSRAPASPPPTSPPSATQAPVSPASVKPAPAKPVPAKPAPAKPAG